MKRILALLAYIILSPVFVHAIITACHALAGWLPLVPACICAWVICFSSTVVFLSIFHLIIFGYYPRFIPSK